MNGKIALEEHWALPETLEDSHQIVAGGIANYWAGLEKNLLDVNDQRLAEMDRHGIEIMILSLNAPAVQAVLDTRKAIDLARRANDALAAEAARTPDRFRAFAALPMQDPAAAAEELTRCVHELGFVGALVNGFTQRDVPDSAIYFDAPEYKPFWKQVEALDVPFYLHPRVQIPSRAQVYEGHPWLRSATWGYARETSIHALRLIGSTLFDDCPKLQIILGHLGERIPYDMWRIDSRMRRNPSGYPCRHPMSHYLRNNFHITTSGHFNDPTLKCAMAEMGIGRVMFSVDYPFEEVGEGAEWFDNCDLSEADRMQIGRSNANALFRLGLA